MLQLGSHAGASVIESGTQDERRAAAAPTGNEAGQMAALRPGTDKFAQIADWMKAQINQLLAAPPALTNAKARKTFANWKAEVEDRHGKNRGVDSGAQDAVHDCDCHSQHAAGR